MKKLLTFAMVFVLMGCYQTPISTDSRFDAIKMEIDLRQMQQWEAFRNAMIDEAIIRLEIELQKEAPQSGLEKTCDMEF